MQVIKSKNDLDYFIKCDSQNYQTNKLGDFILQRPKYLIKKYLFYLRKSEYALNVLQKKGYFTSKFGRVLQIYYRYKMRKLSWKLGFQFYENVLGPGVKILSFGTIIINPGAKIGKNCTIFPGVTIGGKSKNEFPVIGDNCYIGFGAKIIGGIKVGDNAFISPNAVVIKDVHANTVVGGIPSKFIKYV